MKFFRRIGSVINAICRRSYWYKEYFFKDCTKFWSHHTFNLDVVNLGSSSAVHAFCYDDIPLKCANWALIHNPLLADEAILKNYASYLNPQKSVVILPLCPFSALAGSYDYFDDRYYTILYPSSIPSFSLNRLKYIDDVKRWPVKYYPAYEILKDLGHYLSTCVKSRRSVVLTENQMLQDAEKWMYGWKKEFSINTFDDPLSLVNQDAISDAIEILNRVASFCVERNIKPVVVVPPVYHTLGKLITDNMRQQLIETVLSRINNKDVKIFNYLDDADFSDRRDLFENAFFLNRKGARKFTHKVLNDIGII